MAKILIVDDDAGILGLLTEFMVRRGHSVVTASNGADAIARFRTERPDVVFLDIYLPDCTGLEVLCKLKEIKRHVPVVMITGEASDETVAAALMGGSSDYLLKPINFEYLERILHWGLKGLWVVDDEDKQE